jgi:hypothetical protein
MLVRDAGWGSGAGRLFSGHPIPLYIEEKKMLQAACLKNIQGEMSYDSISQF